MKNSEERDKLLQELAYLEQAEYIDKQIYAQLVEIVEQYYSEPDPDTEGVEIERLVSHVDSQIDNLLEVLGDDETTGNKDLDGRIIPLLEDWRTIKQLLTHSSTSGNDMSDKRTVSIESISKFVDKEWEDAGYDILTTPETYEVKAMIADFIQQELGIKVEDEDGD